MRDSTWTVAALVALVFLVGLKMWWIWEPASDAGARSESSFAAPEPMLEPRPSSVAETAAAPAPPPPEATTAAQPVDADPVEKRHALIQADPKLHDRAQQQSLAKKAEERWTRAVDEGEYSADDLDPSIRRFFADVSLEPRYIEDGMITGLVIQDLQDDHPLAIAGFHVGDRLSRIQGVPLRYPEEIPSLLARLGPNFSVCRATSDGGEIEQCKEFMLH